MTPAPPGGGMAPVFLPITRVRRETHDVVTFDLTPPETAARLRFAPGQFNMLYAFGVGEVPISISGDAGHGDRITHTLRAVGPVTQAMVGLKRGDLLGLRGPFGTAWPVDLARGSDVLVIAGGIGLAPLRPVIYHLLSRREDYGRVAVLYGARSPKELLFRQELEAWRNRPGWQQRVTVDHADQNWEGDVGVVTKLLAKVRFDPRETVALVCGPEVMIRFCAFALRDLGVESARVFVSMERSMKCAIGHCGHCQYGPHFVCKDGPVFRFDQIEHLFMAREI